MAVDRKMRDNRSKSSFARRLAKHRLRLGLGHAQELDLFPSESDRASALFDLSQHPGSPTSAEWWIAFTFYVVFTAAASLAIAWWLQFVNWPIAVELSLPILTVATGFWIVRTFTRNRIANRFLRHRLIECGVPVCIACGYCLRGLLADTETCPECGKQIDAAIRRMIVELSKVQSPLREQSNDLSP